MQQSIPDLRINPSHKEYDLEIQAITDEKIGNPRDRIDRASWLIHVLNNMNLTGPFAARRNYFKQVVKEVFGCDCKIQTHGLSHERRMWVSVELDELVIGINRGYRVGYDELTDKYAAHSSRIGIELIKLENGIVYQNSNQLTDPEWLEKIDKVADIVGYPYIGK